MNSRGARHSRLVPVLVVVAAFYVVFVSARINTFGTLWFVHVGHQSLEISNSSPVITNLSWQSEVGYDGQYYYFVAVDPRNARHYMPTIAGFIYSRPLYPALARGLGFGSPGAIPYAMLIVNLLAIGAGTLAVGSWLRRHGVSTWFALLYGLYPGMIFSVFRDLTEPLSFALTAIAVLLFDPRKRSRLAASAVLFALAILTRETVILFALGAAAALLVDERRARPNGLRSWRAWRAPAVFAAAACAPLFAWRLVLGHLVHLPTQERGGEGGAGLIPFHGIATFWPWHGEDLLIVGTVVVPTIVVLAGAFLLFYRRVSRVPAALLIANAFAFVVFLPSGVDVDYGAAGRAALGVVLAAIYCLPSWQRLKGRRIELWVVGLVWSLPWYLITAALLGLSGIALITS